VQTVLQVVASDFGPVFWSLAVARVSVGYFQLCSGPARENGVSDSLTKVAVN